uniref:Putative secreted protein n=1 Tax=Anopheles darlingi TaxID=43151 RepID=A0A2M4D174_ANODA
MMMMMMMMMILVVVIYSTRCCWCVSCNTHTLTHLNTAFRQEPAKISCQAERERENCLLRAIQTTIVVLVCCVLLPEKSMP